MDLERQGHISYGRMSYMERGDPITCFHKNPSECDSSPYDVLGKSIPRTFVEERIGFGGPHRGILNRPLFRVAERMWYSSTFIDMV